jgi:hypothetical protein
MIIYAGKTWTMLKPYIFQISCWGTVAIEMLIVAKLSK